MDQNTLTIRGEHRDVVRDTDTAGRVIRTERSRRSFTRSFNLPLGAGEYLLLSNYSILIVPLMAVSC